MCARGLQYINNAHALGVGCRVHGARYGHNTHNVGLIMQGTGCGVQGAGCGAAPFGRPPSPAPRILRNQLCGIMSLATLPELCNGEGEGSGWCWRQSRYTRCTQQPPYLRATLQPSSNCSCAIGTPKTLDVCSALSAWWGRSFSVAYLAHPYSHQPHTHAPAHPHTYTPIALVPPPPHSPRLRLL